MTLFEELKWRGLINDISSPELEKKLNEGGITFYIGTDPTGDSMHIGHYSSFSVAKRLKDAGHKPILLVGGATGLIGDPKPNVERPMITKAQLEYNYQHLRKQVEDIFGFEVVNNYDWSKDLNYIDYLRDYGKHFSINYMLAKDTVKSRLEIGITYTEFSYMIMQALDFYNLHKDKEVTLQIGGQDQWGNITAGIDLIRKKCGSEVYGFTMPLITKADGTKFGKSEGNAVWLDIEQTSAYEMYQFFLNVEDSMVISYLKYLTFLKPEEIDELEIKHNENPHLREAHKALAKDVITFLHGEDKYNEAVKISEALFNEDITTLKADVIIANLKGVKTVSIENDNIVNVLTNTSICSSKREAREMILGNAISINNRKVVDIEYIFTEDNAIDGQVFVIKKGKKNYYLGKYIG